VTDYTPTVNKGEEEKKRVEKRLGRILDEENIGW